MAQENDNNGYTAAAHELRKDTHNHMKEAADKLWIEVSGLDANDPRQLTLQCLAPEQRETALSRVWTKTSLSMITAIVWKRVPVIILKCLE